MGLVAHLVEEGHLWALAGDLLELRVEVLVLEVLVDERPDLGELVQSSSGARLDDGLVDGVVLPLLPILPLHLVLVSPDNQQEAAQQRQAE